MPTRSQKPKIGAHVSVAGGLANGIHNAKRIGAECIQIFGASPRQWRTSERSEEEAQEFKLLREKESIGEVFLHGAYLVNLASPDSELRHKSEKNLAQHLKIAEAIGANGLIFHIGSGKEMPKEDAFKIVVDAMKRVLESVNGTTQLVIENSAGGGQKIGADPEDIGELISRINSPRVRVCWDTAHAFEAGVIEHHNEKDVSALITRLDNGFGLKNLAALHINDSKTPFNSRHDRHENLGQGHIGMDGFRILAHEKRLWSAAWILEVPGFDNMGPDEKNIQLLKACF